MIGISAPNRQAYPIRLIDTPALCRELAQRWGGVASTLSSVFHGVLTPEAVRTLHRLGAVGHILGRFVDPMGESIATELDERVIALGLDSLRGIPLVLAVAAGAQKAPALAAALRGGLAPYYLEPWGRRLRVAMPREVQGWVL